MKKKIFCLMFLSVLAFSLCGCNWNKMDDSGMKESNDGMITLIYNDGFCVIVKDNRTGVEYISRADAGTCVVVDRDGKPFVDGAEEGGQGMTREEINRIKYMICCPMCDNEKCVRKTDKCEAEIWAKSKAEKEE